VLGGFYGVRYVVFAGTAYALGYRHGVASRWHKLQPAMPVGAQLRREIGYSAIAVLVFGAFNGVLSTLGVLPPTMIYLDVAQYGWAWFALSIVTTLVLQDTYAARRRAAGRPPLRLVELRGQLARAH